MQEVGEWRKRIHYSVVKMLAIFTVLKHNLSKTLIETVPHDWFYT